MTESGADPEQIALESVMGDVCIWCGKYVSEEECKCVCAVCKKGRAAHTQPSAGCHGFFANADLIRPFVRAQDPSAAKSVRIWRRWRDLLHAAMKPHAILITAEARRVYAAHGGKPNCPLCNVKVDPKVCHWRHGLCRSCHDFFSKHAGELA